MKIDILFATIFTGILIGSCSPKTVEKIKIEPEKPAVTAPVEENTSDCPNFSKASNPDDAETNYVLYRDFLKAKELEKSFEFWQKVYAVSPAANGSVHYVYTDGIYFYEQFIRAENDSLKKEPYINRIFELYDELAACFPEKRNYANARKGVKYYFSYKGRKTNEEIYTLFKDVIDETANEAPKYIINPFASLLVELYMEGKVSEADAKHYNDKILEIIKYKLANCEGRHCKAWEDINAYAPLRLEYFETVKGFYDCDYFMNKYYPLFEKSPEDCEVIRNVYSRLSWGFCDKEDDRFKTLAASAKKRCIKRGTIGLAIDTLQAGHPKVAIKLLKQALTEGGNVDKKGEINLIIAKIYFANLKNFPQSRKYARLAAKEMPKSGEPYLLIGTLYASSGPLCGSGRGWNSQVVVWAAIDKWKKAKRMDSSVARKAQKLINQYSQYMPDRAAIHQRLKKIGDSYTVPCWIQEKTIIRAAD